MVQVLTFARNLASQVRQNFQGIPTSPQPENDEPAIRPTTGKRSGGQVFNFTVVLLDPNDDSIPRGNARTDLKNTGRIVQLSVSRGMQERGALRALNDAFPFLQGVTTK